MEKKVKIAEATEKKVRDETIKVREETTRTLIDELEAATRKVEEFQGEKGGILYKIYVKNKTRLEGEVSIRIGISVEEDDE